MILEYIFVLYVFNYIFISNIVSHRKYFVFVVFGTYYFLNELVLINTTAGHCNDTHRDQSCEQDMHYMRGNVSLVRNHPGLIAYYICDGTLPPQSAMSSPRIDC